MSQLNFAFIRFQHGKRWSSLWTQWNFTQWMWYKWDSRPSKELYQSYIPRVNLGKFRLFGVTLKQNVKHFIVELFALLYKIYSCIFPCQRIWLISISLKVKSIVHFQMINKGISKIYIPFSRNGLIIGFFKFISSLHKNL